ncbi:MAG: hypothetical protein ACRCYR_07565 [Phycicoccus sp.]
MDGRGAVCRGGECAGAGQALDVLVGPGRWVPREEVGSFPLRFPHPEEPDDAGWHIDAAFLPDGREPRAETSGGYSDWRVNVSSKGRAAQPHHGTRPRLMSQPGIEPAVPLDPFGPAGRRWPVEEAIRLGLDRATADGAPVGEQVQ